MAVRAKGLYSTLQIKRMSDTSAHWHLALGLWIFHTIVLRQVRICYFLPMLGSGYSMADQINLSCVLHCRRVEDNSFGKECVRINYKAYATTGITKIWILSFSCYNILAIFFTLKCEIQVKFLTPYNNNFFHYMDIVK